MSSDTSSPVLVTGGTGFLGSWCVSLLLERGYTVHTTCRSLDKAQYLLALPGATERLKIFPNVDLLVDGAFEEAMAGCESVLHTASPFYMGSEEALMGPAVDGTRNVLTTCAKLGVKKVVLTSSTASVYVNYGSESVDKVYSEADWSPEDVLREKKNWYALSKVSAERVAWEMSRQPGCPYALGVMLPTLILGPQIAGQPHLNTSHEMVLKLFDGSYKLVSNGCKALVDVRDVAEAHVNCLERPDALGRRYLLIASSPHYREISDVVRACVPEELRGNVPTELSPTLDPWVMAQPAPLPVLFDASLAQSVLGVTFRGTEVMVRASVRTLLDNGYDGKAK